MADPCEQIPKLETGWAWTLAILLASVGGGNLTPVRGLIFQRQRHTPEFQRCHLNQALRSLKHTWWLALKKGATLAALAGFFRNSSSLVSEAERV